MRGQLGEEYSGLVSAVTSFGIFVTLDALYVEGLVHITELRGEYFRYDEARQELRGERTGIRYALGTRVRVQVSRVDLDGREIDFRLVQEGLDALPVRSARDKGGKGSKGGAAPKAMAQSEARKPAPAGRASPKRHGKAAAKAEKPAAKGKARKARR